MANSPELVQMAPLSVDVIAKKCNDSGAASIVLLLQRQKLELPHQRASQAKATSGRQRRRVAGRTASTCAVDVEAISRESTPHLDSDGPAGLVLLGYPWGNSRDLNIHTSSSSCIQTPDWLMLAGLARQWQQQRFQWQFSNQALETSLFRP